MNRRSLKRKAVLCAAATFLCVVLCDSARADVITEWNQHAFNLTPSPASSHAPVQQHTTNSSAMAVALSLLFGNAPGVPLEVKISGIKRKWDTFDEAAREVIDTRVYSGIHFRTADEVGARTGRQVARFVSTHALRPCPKGRSRCHS